MNIAYENLGKVNKAFVADFESALRNVLQSGWYILGEQVTEFERAFAEYHGSRYCIGVANGYDALILALKALQLPEKSEVIVAANAYVACVLSILRAGLVPVLVEPDLATANIDPHKIEEKITSRTRVIMPVHLYGNPCDMTIIGQLAKQYNLQILEDCAQAHGAMWEGKKVGTFSSIAAFSFYPTKNLGALGDAGALLTDDKALADKLKMLRNYGSQIKYHNDCVGYNSRLDEMQAAFLRVKLPHLDAINAHKRALAAIYDTELTGYARAKPQKGAHSVYHIYNIYAKNREALRDYLKQEGIGTEVHYPIAPYRQKALQNRWALNYPLSDAFHETTLSLPLSYAHTPEEIKRICEVMNAYKEKL